MLGQNPDSTPRFQSQRVEVPDSTTEIQNLQQSQSSSSPTLTPSSRRPSLANTTNIGLVDTAANQTSRKTLTSRMASSSSRSPLSLGLLPSDPAKDTNPRLNVGRPIMANRANRSEEELQTLPRRRSVVTQTQTTTVRNPPSARSSPRKPTPSTSQLPPRRTSLPAIHLRPASTDSTSGMGTHHTEQYSNPSHFTNDDLYSNLATFTFGAAAAGPSTSNADEDVDMISPLQTPARRPSTDRTPRPSVSRHHDENQDETSDLDEAARQRRSKMRAVDDGSRRPSLPTNVYSERRISSDHSDLDTDVELEPSERIASDTASQHTFGGSRTGHETTIFDSSLDLSHPVDVDGASLRGASVSPVAGGQGNDTRRGSNSMDVDWEASAELGGRGREGSLMTLRRPSRGMNDLLAGAGASGEPGGSTLQTMPDWNQSGQQDQETEGSADAYAGLDMDYILGNAPRRGSTQSYLQPGASAHRLSLDNNHAGTPAGFTFPGWGLAINAARRPSTATIGSDDAFMRHVKRMDDAYDLRKNKWSFNKETVDAGVNSVSAASQEAHKKAVAKGLPAALPVGTQELWKCQFVGRFRVDRLLMTYPNKPPQQRLNVRHIKDPYVNGNNVRGGPGVVIHKHSKAVAFSIFRSHSLFGAQREGVTNISMNSSILLATKKVQEQYTSTRTTSNLNTHGLLEDRPSGRSGEPNTSHGRPSTSGGRTGREKKKDKGKDRAKSLNRSTENEDKWREVSPLSDTSYTTHHALTSSSSFERMSSPPRGSGSTAESSSSKASSLDHSESSTSAISSREHDSSTMPIRDRADSMDMDMDDEFVPSRTSHAEAFAAIDMKPVDAIRPRGGVERASPSPPPPRSLLGFFTPHLQKGTHKAHAGPHSASLEANYKPPWLTMAPRATQEANERVIQNLNDSFKDVGLLPSIRPNKPRSKKGGRTKGADIFEPVPEDSLYMLLPLWAGETDPSSSRGSKDDHCQIPLEQRQYLLVYYVPFENDPNKTQNSNKKRTRSQTTSDAPSPRPDKNIVLKSFRVCSRVLGYEELRGSGVRLPSEGLSVTGSLPEAMQTIPDAAMRLTDWHDQVIVIGWCSSREAGIEFIPEGLEKLGLCIPISGPVANVGFGFEEEPQWELTAIGRAAVEMAWLGSIALTSFGNP